MAQVVRNNFARFLATARSQGRIDLGPEPDAGDIEAIIDTAFWASLRREEGMTPTISLALLPLLFLELGLILSSHWVQRLGDLAAGSVVIMDPRSEV